MVSKNLWINARIRHESKKTDGNGVLWHTTVKSADCPMTLGLVQIVAVAKAASMTRIAECKLDRNMFAPNVAFRMTFGQSPTAIVAVAGNMK